MPPAVPVSRPRMSPLPVIPPYRPKTARTAPGPSSSAMPQANSPSQQATNTVHTRTAGAVSPGPSAATTSAAQVHPSGRATTALAPGACTRLAPPGGGVPVPLHRPVPLPAAAFLRQQPVPTHLNVQPQLPPPSSQPLPLQPHASQAPDTTVTQHASPAAASEGGAGTSGLPTTNGVPTPRPPPPPPPLPPRTPADNSGFMFIVGEMSPPVAPVAAAGSPAAAASAQTGHVNRVAATPHARSPSNCDSFDGPES